MHLVLDSTGLELFGQGEWHAAKHGRARKRWMKLHLGVDAITGEVVAHVLTDGQADDVAQVPDLLRQLEGAIASLTADGAYDGEPVYQASAGRQPGQHLTVVIPPRSSAVLSTADPDKQNPRDRHIQLITEHRRMVWRRMTGYGGRDATETTVARYKHPIGPRLRARKAATQAGQVALIIQVITRMIWEAKPITIRRR